jgi:hypothetical protein
MIPPMRLPSIGAGIFDTSHAASGAARIPPSSSPPIVAGSSTSLPRPTRNPTLAATATTNSEVSTDPMTVRGAVFPAVSRAGVATGPQPPPPEASTNPSGDRNRAPCGDTRAVAILGGRVVQLAT